MVYAKLPQVGRCVGLASPSPRFHPFQVTKLVKIVGWTVLWGVPALVSAEEERPFLFSPVTEIPEWRLLESHQGTITRAQFEDRWRRIYDSAGVLAKYIRLTDEGVELFRDTAKTQSLFYLRFASGEGREERGLSVASWSPEKPLLGKVICLDPGHIGGDWADVEERTFRIGRDRPVVEGELNLKTCRLLAKRLQDAGAQVVWTHQGFEPTTRLRPNDLYPEAIQYMLQDVKSRRFPSYSANGLIRWNAELLFYRTAEIQARARKVNEELRPDLTLCLHYNAAPWGRAGRASLATANRVVLFAHGAYTADELAYDDQKFHLFQKLLENSNPEELEIGAAVGKEFKEKWSTPPEDCGNSGYAHATGASPYLWYRNLIANRLFHGPVIFVEGPYMNDRTSYSWIQAGEYEGTRLIGGRMRENIFREYADRVADGVVGVFREWQKRSPAFTNYSP